ncbi:MAG: carotene hydroxylase [Bacteroidota bacterium]|jgi:beta-carotene 3-hydroxylase
MHAVFNISVVIITFLVMEFMAWFTHKYVMHGLMWYFHYDHHNGRKGFFERNDVFFLIFAIPGWLFTMFGMMNGNDWRLFVGIGIILYGLAYFLVHDVYIHQRFKWFKNSNWIYFRAIRRAHRAHHSHLDKNKGESFGMLIVGRKYWQQARNSK